MKIEDLKHGLFMFRGNLFLKFPQDLERNKYGIYALALKLDDDAIDVEKLMAEEHFVGDIQPVSISFATIARPATFRETHIGDVCFLYERKKGSETQYFNEKAPLHVRWQSQGLIPDGDLHYAINLIDASVCMTQPHFEFKKHQEALWNWPVRKIGKIKLVPKKDIKEAI